MKMHLYHIYDMISGTTIGPIMQYPRDAAAIRAFTEILADERSDMHKYPTDFTLLTLGWIDNTTGQIDATNPTPVYDGVTYLAERERLAQRSPALAPAGNNNGPADAAAGL